MTHHGRKHWLDLWRQLGASEPWRSALYTRAIADLSYRAQGILAPLRDAQGKLDRYISLRFDTTAAQRVAHELAVECTRLDHILRGTNVGTWEWNVQTGETRLNARWAEMLGLPPKRFGRIDVKTWFGYFEPDDLRRSQLAMARHFRGETDYYSAELRLRHDDGHWVWVVAHGKVFSWTADDRPEWMAGTHLDVTERMRIEEALQLTNERFALAASSAGIGVWDHDLARNRLTWDDRMYQIYGRARDSGFDPLAGWHGCIHPEDRAQLESKVHAVIATGRVFDTEYRVCWPNGALRDVRTTGQVVRSEQGRALRITGVSFDVTERKCAEQAIRQSERFMRIVTANLPGMVAYWSAELRCTFANAAFSAWLGDTGQPLIGGAMFALLGAARLGEHQRYATAALSGEEQRVEHRSRGPDGQLHDYWLYYLPDRDGDTIQGVISVMIDVSELKHAQARLEELNAALQERTRQAECASVAKSAFLANTSHEIRTPLHAVIGLAYLLEQSKLDAEQANCVGKIKLAGRSLLDVINNVLDLSKIEAGEMPFEESSFNVRLLVEDLLSIMGVQANAKRIQLDVVLSAALPQVLRGDVIHLRQILTNLLSNAIKFTEKGSVQLTVNVVERATTRVRLRFAVHDTGIGIAPEVQTLLFTPFTQADASTTRRFGGTGLGLSIVKRLVLLMDGEVALTSTLGEGSEFAVTIPFGIELPSVTTAALPLQVLVVSDELGPRAELFSTARALGWHVEGLDVGPRLFERMREQIALQSSLDVIVLAWSRSVGEALDGLVCLGAGGAVATRLPAIVLVTPNEPRRVQAESRAFGFEVTALQTPISTSTLFDAIQESVASQGSLPEPLHEESFDATRLRGARLLVVDDSQINLEVAQCLLEREGARVTVANNGQEAVERLRSSPKAFDAVLMDIQMPVLDGLEAARCIRQTLGLLSLPIFALTAGALVGERQRAVEAGMDGFISKPFEPRTMFRALCLRLPKPTVSHAAPLVPPESLPRAWPEVLGVDTADAFARCGGDQQLFVHVLRHLLDEFGQLTTAVSTADPEELASRMHKLSGSAGMIAATELSHAAKTAERLLRYDAAEGRRAIAQSVLTGLLQLRESAAPVLAASSDRAVAPAGSSLALDEPPADGPFEELTGLLEGRRIEALDVFDALSPVLHSRLGDPGFAALRTAVIGLEYRTALQILSTA